MDSSLAVGYSSNRQISRLVTEDWAARNLFCLACPSAQLVSETPNRPVRDFTCHQCRTTYQLKSQEKRFGGSVANSAYGPKVEAIKQGRAPHYVFLQYTKPAWKVANLFVVPGHFITLAVIRKRAPLPDYARRSGWVGSTILLQDLPAEGRVSVVDEGMAREPDEVREDWHKFEFLKSDARAKGGWGAEILTCVRRLQAETGANEFSLQQFYARYGEELAVRHPENHNVEPKIRQQLQVLRDGKLLDFLERGRYRIIG